MDAPDAVLPIPTSWVVSLSADVSVIVLVGNHENAGILLDAIAEVGFLPLPTVPPTAPPTTAPTISNPTMKTMNFPLLRRNGSWPAEVFSA